MPRLLLLVAAVACLAVGALGMCPTIHQPVCSKSTGKTYQNECFALQDGVRDVVAGECPKEEDKPAEEESSEETKPDDSKLPTNSPKMYVTPEDQMDENQKDQSGATCGLACSGSKTFVSKTETTEPTTFGHGSVTTESSSPGSSSPSVDANGEEVVQPEFTPQHVTPEEKGSSSASLQPKS